MKSEIQRKADQNIAKAAIRKYTEWRLPSLAGLFLGFIVLLLLPRHVLQNELLSAAIMLVCLAFAYISTILLKSMRKS